MENELSKVTVERFWQMPENALPDSKVYDCTLCRDSGWLLDGADARPCICRSEATLRRRRLLPEIQRDNAHTPSIERDDASAHRNAVKPIDDAVRLARLQRQHLARFYRQLSHFLL